MAALGQDARVPSSIKPSGIETGNGRAQARRGVRHDEPPRQSLVRSSPMELKHLLRGAARRARHCPETAGIERSMRHSPAGEPKC